MRSGALGAFKNAKGAKGAPFAVSSVAWTVKFGRQKTYARQKRPGLRRYHSITTRIIKPMMEQAVVNAGMISMEPFGALGVGVGRE
jgi:hypothetical protein